MKATRLVSMVVIASVLVALPLTVQRVCCAHEAPAITARSIHGAGAWKTDGKAQRPAQQWDIDVTRSDDNSIRGRISVADSPLFTAGNVEGKIEGQTISGTISDDGGNQIATFSGTVTPTEMSGSYRDLTGEVGRWRWEGGLPQ